MRKAFLIFQLLSVAAYGQQTPKKDAVLLEEFWRNFTTAIQKGNRQMLAESFEFSFYCRPCIDYYKPAENSATLKVTRKIFFDRNFSLSGFKKVISDPKFNLYNFRTSKDDDGKTVYWLPYTIVKPGKTWEGMQGIIYLMKIGGKFKITGIDTVP